VVLVSFVLVVVAAITLVIGLLQSGLSIIYVSIACSLLAGIVLFTAVLRGRPAPRGAGGPMPQQVPQTAPPPAAPAAEWSAPASTSAPGPESVPEPAMAGAVGAGTATSAVDERDDHTETLDLAEFDAAVGAGDDFPIHDYDTLRATEVLPMLAELSDEQLEAVKEREQGGKNRFMILNRIDGELKTRGAKGWEVDDAGWEPQAAVEEKPVPLFQNVRTGSAGPFPIPDYDDLKALEVLGRLSDLNVVELQIVRQHEEDGSRRAMVLNRIDRLIEEAPPEPAPVVASAKRRASSRTAKAPAAKRAPAKAPAARRQPRVAKAAPARTAAPPKKLATAKKVGVAKRTAPAKKAPATKAAATKSTVAKKTAQARKAGKRVL